MSVSSPQSAAFLQHLLPELNIQLRSSLSNMHTALSHIAPEQTEDSAVAGDCAVLYQSYYRLLRLIDHLEAAPLLFQPPVLTLQDEDAAQLCSDVLQHCQEPAELCGVQLRGRLEKASCVIALHRPMLQQLLMELISNALKATPSGGQIHLTLQVLPTAVRITVTDTGCGIPSQRLGSVFEFSHRPPLDLTQPQGLGLGLPLCRWIAQAHGGTIALLSAPQQGTSVTLSLPNRKCGNLPSGNSGCVESFNPTLVALSDALPSTAFTARYLD